MTTIQRPNRPPNSSAPTLELVDDGRASVARLQAAVDQARADRLSGSAAPSLAARPAIAPARIANELDRKVVSLIPLLAVIDLGALVAGVLIDVLDPAVAAVAAAVTVLVGLAAMCRAAITYKPNHKERT